LYIKKVRTARYIIFTTALLLGCFVQARGRGTSYGTFRGAQYVRNYDGDSITMNLPGLHPILGKEIVIRVAGVDTPEIKGQCTEEKAKAREAKRFVKSILQDAKTIDLYKISRGKYFRILADVQVDGQDLGTILVDRGLAVEYYGGKKTKDWCGSGFDWIGLVKDVISFF